MVIPEADPGTVNVLVNDKVFFVRNPDLTAGANYYATGDKRVTLFAADSTGAVFTVVTPSNPRTGTFPIHQDILKDASGAYGTYSFNFFINSTLSTRFFHTSSAKPGLLTITKFDTMQKLISGRFYYTAEEDNPIWDSGRVNIKGSFTDIRYVKL